MPPSLPRGPGDRHLAAAGVSHSCRERWWREELNRDYFQAAGEPKELWQVEDSGHISGITAQPNEYEQRVIGFFDRWLLRR